MTTSLSQRDKKLLRLWPLISQHHNKAKKTPKGEEEEEKKKGEEEKEEEEVLTRNRKEMIVEHLERSMSLLLSHELTTEEINKQESLNEKGRLSDDPSSSPCSFWLDVRPSSVSGAGSIPKRKDKKDFVVNFVVFVVLERFV